MRQTLLTYVDSVTGSGQVDVLRKEIETAESGVGLSGNLSVHFSSMFLAGDSHDRKLFVWENNFDGSEQDFLDWIVSDKKRSEAFENLFAHCEVWKKRDSNDIRKYLREIRVKPSAYHIGAPGLSVGRIHRERVLAAFLQDQVDETHRYGESLKTVGKVQDYLRQNVCANKELIWAQTPEQRLGLWDRTWRWVSVTIITLLQIPFLIPLAPIILFLIRRLEDRERPDTILDPAHVNKLLEDEDKTVQNHLAVVIPIKAWRCPVLWWVLFNAWFQARIQTRGKLGGIPGIFFAHWSIVKREGWPRQLLFVSNYSGAWSGYLDDFIDLASWGLTPVWTNTVGFPKTRLLNQGGSRDRTAFKDYVRKHQSGTLMWHQAYKSLTVQEVNRNSAIRDGLFRKMTPAGQRKWARLL